MTDTQRLLPHSGSEPLCAHTGSAFRRADLPSLPYWFLDVPEISWVASWDSKSFLDNDQGNTDAEIDFDSDCPLSWRGPRKNAFSAPVINPWEISILNDFAGIYHDLEDLKPMPDSMIAYEYQVGPGRISTSRLSEESISDSKIAHEPDSTSLFSSTITEVYTFESEELPEDLRKGLRKDLSKGLPEDGVRLKKRFDLPLNIFGATHSTRHDSGSHENAMAKEMALKLGLKIEDTAEYQKEFRIANGKVVKALGRTSVDCAFTAEPHMQHLCSFYVFATLVTPIIMGMAFLDATETLTKHKRRLRSTMVPANGPAQICALNNPGQRLRCSMNRESVLANADTGSEIDLISLAYAKSRGLAWIEFGAMGNHKVQFADGSESFLAGKTFLSFKR